VKKFELARPGKLRDTLIKAVLNGRKTATSSLYDEWVINNEALPEVGEEQELVNSQQEAIGIIKIVDVRKIRLDEIDMAIAESEGEGYASVLEWRMSHEKFWSPITVNDDTIVVVEHFELINQL
jgi:uncharacterized protein YhfF